MGPCPPRGPAAPRGRDAGGGRCEAAAGALPAGSTAELLFSLPACFSGRPSEILTPPPSRSGSRRGPALGGHAAGATLRQLSNPVYPKNWAGTAPGGAGALLEVGDRRGSGAVGRACPIARLPCMAAVRNLVASWVFLVMFHGFWGAFWGCFLIFWWYFLLFFGCSS